MSEDPQRNATSFVVCYHAARLGHTIDVKRVDDATVPITDVIACWTCQTFTDIARGRGREETSGISGWRASLPPARSQARASTSTERGLHVFWGLGRMLCIRGCIGVDLELGKLVSSSFVGSVRGNWRQQILDRVRAGVNGCPPPRVHDARSGAGAGYYMDVL